MYMKCACQTELKLIDIDEYEAATKIRNRINSQAAVNIVGGFDPETACLAYRRPYMVVQKLPTLSISPRTFMGLHVKDKVMFSCCLGMSLFKQKLVFGSQCLFLIIVCFCNFVYLQRIFWRINVLISCSKEIHNELMSRYVLF